MKLLIIGCGGFLGAISRYLVSISVTRWIGSTMPYGTLVVNVIGSFLLGFLYTVTVDKIVISENIRFFVGVGFLGAFTTFSTFSVETLHLVEEGAYGLAAGNILLNVILSLAGAFSGMMIAKL